jgi:hypothetical protein
MAERAGAEPQALGRLSASLEDPAALIENPDDVGAFDVFECVGGGRGRRTGARMATPETKRAVDLQDWAGREDQGPVDDVLELADVPGPVIEEPRSGTDELCPSILRIDERKEPVVELIKKTTKIYPMSGKPMEPPLLRGARIMHGRTTVASIASLIVLLGALTGCARPVRLSGKTMCESHGGNYSAQTKQCSYPAQQPARSAQQICQALGGQWDDLSDACALDERSR